MLDAKQAAEKALNYFQDFYNASTFGNLQVEEVEVSDEGWLITLGYDDISTEALKLLNIGKRKYKIFTIDKSIGTVKSMKIRVVE